MGEMGIATLLAGGASMAGAKVGDMIMGGSGAQGPSNQQYIDKVIKNMNNMLNDSMNSAMQNSEAFTNKGIGQLNTSLDKSTGALNTGLTNSTQALTNYLNNAQTAAQRNSQQGFLQSQALQAPYAQMGYNASDAYMDSLGLARPQMGSAALASNLNSAANLFTPIQQLQQVAQANNNADPFTAPVAPTAPKALDPYSGLTPEKVLAGIPMDQIQQTLQNSLFFGKNVPQGATVIGYNEKKIPIFLSPGASNLGDKTQSAYNIAGHKKVAQMAQEALGNATYQDQVRQYLAQDQLAEAQKQQAAYQQQVDAYNKAQGQYQQQMSLFTPQQQAYNNLSQQLSTMSPQQLQTAAAYSNGLFGGAK